MPDRLEAELLAHAIGVTPVRTQGLGLPAGAVQREHAELEQVLAVRMGLHEALQLGHELTVEPELEIGLDPALGRDQDALLEARDLRRHPRIERDVGERAAANQAEGCTEVDRSRSGVSADASRKRRSKTSTSTSSVSTVSS